MSDRITERRVAVTGSVWWWDVPGLDPERPCADISLAARYTAIACAIRVIGIGLVVRRDTARWALRNHPAVKQVNAWYVWLAEAPDQVDAAVRRLALRQACDLPVDDPAYILSTAQALCAAAPHQPQQPQGTTQP